MKSKVIKIFSVLFIFIGFMLVALGFYIKNVFNDAKFEQLIYSLKYATGTSSSVIIDGFKYCLIIGIIFTIIMIIPFIPRYKRKSYLYINFKKSKEFKFQILPIKHYLIYSIIILILSILFILNSTGFFTYLNNQIIKTTIYEDYYVNPDDVKIVFPAKKQNLIYIYLESMESNYAYSRLNNKEINLIPNLTSIAFNNISFSHNDMLGGAANLNGANYTIAAMVAQSTGIPLRTLKIANDYHDFNSFLPGAKGIGEILKSEGYNQVLFIGSEAEFGGRNEFYEQHGQYEIMDYNWARDNQKIDEDYYVFWGYEDNKLFENAKEVLLDLSKKEAPFNFTMLTVDTHPVDGYLDKSCKNTYSNSYANVISCSDKMISNFISWIQRQDFFKNTTIVLVGDHISMQTNVKDFLIENTNRYTYNAFINSRANTNNTNNRSFTNFDLFPTTLASLGVTIDGNKLGLGTNLFSNEKTLTEETSVNYVFDEIQKNSDFYNSNFLKDTYIEMMLKDK